MELWRVPGAVLGIIDHGKVVYTGAFGYRDCENHLPVTEDTVFPIGSATKAFTTTAIGMLIDKGKLDPDKPLIQYLPEFEMLDHEVARRVTPRDLMCHRTGLPMHEYLWFNSPYSRKELVRRIRYLEPCWSVREQWHYNNLMYTALGLVVEKLSGVTWEQFIQKHIFAPLGMGNTTTGLQAILNTENHAQPYEQGEGVFPIPFRNIDAVGPAGSINSNLPDMLRWLRFQMQNGRWNDTELVSTQWLEQTHTQHIPCRPYGWSFPEIQANAYGLGWFVDIFRGRRLISHAGNIDGFSAYIGFMPDEDVGVVVLTNMNNTFMIHGLLYQTMDGALGHSEVNWGKRMKFEVNRFFAMLEKMKESILGKESVPISKQDREECVGHYENEGYGSLEIFWQDEELHLLFNNIDYPMRAVAKDRFGISFDIMQIAFPVKLQRDSNGSVSAVAVAFDRFVNDIVFTRVST